MEKARACLARIARRPGMYAFSREALLALVSGILEMACERSFDPRNDFYKRHLGTRGCAYVGLLENFDDEWARVVVKDALAILERCL